MSDRDFALGLVYGLAHNDAALRYRLFRRPLDAAPQVREACEAELAPEIFASLRRAIMEDPAEWTAPGGIET